MRGRVVGLKEVGLLLAAVAPTKQVEFWKRKVEEQSGSLANLAFYVSLHIPLRALFSFIFLH